MAKVSYPSPNESKDQVSKRRDFSDNASASPQQGSKLGMASADKDPKRDQDRLGGEPTQPGELDKKFNRDQPAEGSRAGLDKMLKKSGPQK